MTTIFETATFGGGCFWCLEAVFQDLAGVKTVVSGYAGGHLKNPTYQQVCSGETGHAEVVQIHFDPVAISYNVLLQVFWHIHDPTSLNKQGGDAGTQYRSAVFYHTEAQKNLAERSKHEHESSGEWANPFVTEIVPLENFYPAEEYHRDYFALNPNQPYCQMVVAPKVAKFRKNFPRRLKT